MDVKEAARRTREEHINIQAAPEQSWPYNDYSSTGLRHVEWMLDRIEAGDVSGEKAHRWLGWAQCAIVSAEAGTLEEMKAINHAA